MRKTFAFLLFVSLLFSCSERDRYIRITGYAQGGTYGVSCNLKGVKATPAEIQDSIDSILHLIDTTLSGYNKGSLLSRFNAGEAIRPNRLFLDMYRISYQWFVRSGGYLDFAAGPLYDAWGFGFKSGEMPSEEKIREIVASSGMKKLPAELPLADGLLDPSALGFPKGKPWSIGIDRPVDGNDSPGKDMSAVWLSSGKAEGVVTSGNYRKFYIRDGKKYAHTIDPLSGYPVDHNLLSATIVAPDAASADALATWCMVIGLDAARELILADDSLEGYLVSAGEDGAMEEWASPGFSLKPTSR